MDHSSKYFAQQTHSRDFYLYLTARFFSTISVQAISVGVGWEVYQITQDPLSLGLVGLLQFFPIFALSFISGALADRVERHKIVAICQVLLLTGSIFLLFSGNTPISKLHAIYIAIFLIGIARAFLGPAAQAFLTHLVSERDFSKAVAKTSSAWQFAIIFGPSLGGVIYSIFGTATSVYLTSAFAMILGILTFSLIHTRSEIIPSNSNYVEEIKEGLKFVFQRKLILGAISLDLFAVLFGGATALLPIYASDILNIGPAGLGYLKSAPGVGAAITGIFLSIYPIKKNVGNIMFLCVGLFGALTILFGISNHFYFSLVFLFFMGAFDLVSVVIRQSLIQLRTPSHMRGRVSAVNVVFISASNELGEFESGVTAKWFGTVPAVVLGGLGTLAVTCIWYKMFPSLKQLNTLENDENRNH